MLNNYSLKMNIYVNAIDYGKVLTIPAEPNELVRSIKAKINQQMNGIVPEEIIDSLNYAGQTLDCSTPLSAYGIGNGAWLNMAKSLIPPGAPQPPPQQQVFQPQPYYPQPQVYHQIPAQPQFIPQQPQFIPQQPQFIPQPQFIAQAQQPFFYGQKPQFPQHNQGFFRMF